MKGSVSGFGAESLCRYGKAKESAKSEIRSPVYALPEIGFLSMILFFVLFSSLVVGRKMCSEIGIDQPVLLKLTWYALDSFFGFAAMAVTSSSSVTDLFTPACVFSQSTTRCFRVSLVR